MFGFSLPLLGVLNWSFVGKMDHPVALVSWLAFDGRDLTSVFRDVAVSRRAGAWNLRGFFVSLVLSRFPPSRKCYCSAVSQSLPRPLRISRCPQVNTAIFLNGPDCLGVRMLASFCFSRTHHRPEKTGTSKSEIVSFDSLRRSLAESRSSLHRCCRAIPCLTPYHRDRPPSSLCEKSIVTTGELCTQASPGNSRVGEFRD